MMGPSGMKSRLTPRRRIVTIAWHDVTKNGGVACVASTEATHHAGSSRGRSMMLSADAGCSRALTRWQPSPPKSPPTVRAVPRGVQSKEQPRYHPKSAGKDRDQKVKDVIRAIECGRHLPLTRLAILAGDLRHFSPLNPRPPPWSPVAHSCSGSSPICTPRVQRPLEVLVARPRARADSD